MSVSFAEMSKVIGSTVQVKVEAFTVPMVVRDVKTAYGNLRYLVAPSGGTGEAWVDAGRVRVIPQP